MLAHLDEVLVEAPPRLRVRAPVPGARRHLPAQLLSCCFPGSSRFGDRGRAGRFPSKHTHRSEAMFTSCNSTSTHTHSLPRLHGRNCDDVTPNSSRKYREIPFSTVSPRRCRVCRVWVSVGDSLRSQIKNVFTDNKRFYLTEIQWNRLCIRGTNTVLTEMI